MFQNFNQKAEIIENINFSNIQSVNCSTNNNLNSKKDKSKLPKKQFQTSIEVKKRELNLLDFYNENIDPKKYFENKKKEEKLKQIQDLNNQKNNLYINNSNSNYLINNNSKNNNDNSSFFDLDFSDSESEEIKKEREEIIKKMETKTDDISPIEFDIFDYSKCMDIFDIFDIFDKFEIPFFKEKNKKDDIIIDYGKISTHSTYPHNSKIELVKKGKIKNEKNIQKRMNKFKRMEHYKYNEKSKSTNKNKERSRSRSRYN